MAYACSVKGGKPTLNSAPPTRHEIVGKRQKRTYTACKDAAAQHCRTMMVHSFKVRCGKTVAPWPQLAAQVRTNDVGTSWMEGGQLNLLLKNSDPKPGGKRMARFVMPHGYAPIDELGARLVTGEQAAAKTAAASKKPGSHADEKSPTSSGRRITPMIDNAIVVQPMPDATAIPALLDNNVALGDDEKGTWQTVVHRGVGPSGTGGGAAAYSAGSSGFAVSSSNLMLLFAAFAGTSLLAALGWYGRRYAIAGTTSAPAIDTSVPGAGVWAKRVSGAMGGVAAKLRARWVKFKWRRLRAGRPFEWRNANIANGTRSAEALFERADVAVRNLGPVSALRDTLSLELKAVRQRLDHLRTGSGEQAKTARVAASLRSLVRDLERIGRIADSAAATVKGGREDLVMPKTRAEAFEVLGVNPDATEATLKRIVDALRMGWHPDHAKDEADKLLREERTKQINIAWDLIMGKRGN